MASYLKYIIRNLEPVRVADGATSQSGQTNALRFIPGSAVRGIVINSFAMAGDLEEYKKLLFSDKYAYMNAYPTAPGHTLIPSPKGFYEDKRLTDGEKEIQNVVIDGSFTEGFKRAGLGKYCYIENGCIHYFGVKTGSDMKLLMNGESRKVFRNEYLEAGQFFEGYIRLSGETGIDLRIKDIFEKGKLVVFGNGRSAGMGKCRVVFSETMEKLPYQGEGFDQEGDAYLMLLSDTVLRNENGELCGFDTGEPGIGAMLKDFLGVEEIKVAFASTSTRRIAGYNRTWGTRMPEMTAYEAGSVFHITFAGTLTKAKMEEACDKGLGIRKNEGFGRILFLKDYEAVKKKLKGSISWPKEKKVQDDLGPKDEATLKAAARGYYKHLLDDALERYVVEHADEFRAVKAGISSSQLGTVESRLMLYRYDPAACRENLRGFFEHAGKKESSQRIQKSMASGQAFRSKVMAVLDEPLSKTLFGKDENPSIMGIALREFFPEEEEERYKLKLLIRMIRYDHKEVE